MLIFETTEPNFSFILAKNPSSGVKVEPIKKGYLFGYFLPENNQTYCVTFADPPNTSSFHHAQNASSGDYVNDSQFCSADQLYLTISSYMSHLIKPHKPFLKPTTQLFTHQLHWNPVRFTPSVKYLVRQLWKIGIDCQIVPIMDESRPTGLFSFNLKWTTYQTWAVFVHYLYLLAHSLLNEHEPVGSIITLAGIVESHPEIPYFWRKSLLIRSCGLTGEFDKWKSRFMLPGMKLYQGNNAQIRGKFLQSHLLSECHLVIDIGCGDHPVWLHKDRPASYAYIGVDILSQVRQRLQDKYAAVEMSSDQKGVNFVSKPGSVSVCQCVDQLTPLFPTFPPDYRVTVCLGEVLEHMSSDQAKQIMKTVWTWQPKTILMTTPNKQFNTHYLLEDHETRDEDHVNEMSFDQWQSWMDQTFQQWKSENMDKISTPYTSKWFQIGDSISQVHSIVACVMTR